MKPLTICTATCRVRFSAKEGICWQTKHAYPTAKAHQLARMFAANKRNDRATVVKAGRDTAVIRIYPNSLTGIYRRVRAALLDRLREEGAGFQFTRRTDGMYDCFNPKSKATWIVGPDGCSCPQFARAALVGCPCKHFATAQHRGLLPLAGDCAVAA